MKVYQTDRNGYFLFETIADPDPLVPDNFLIPNGCVITPPPKTTEHQIAQYSDGEWVTVDNYLGFTYWTPEGIKVTISEVGVSPPEGSLTERPVFLDEVKADLVGNVAKWMDEFAQSWGYDSLASGVSYAEEPSVQKFQNEGKALRSWRSLVWEAAYSLSDSVTIDTKFEDMLPLLPEPPTRME